MQTFLYSVSWRYEPALSLSLSLSLSVRSIYCSASVAQSYILYHVIWFRTLIGSATGDDSKRQVQLFKPTQISNKAIDSSRLHPRPRVRNLLQAAWRPWRIHRKLVTLCVSHSLITARKYDSKQKTHITHTKPPRQQKGTNFVLRASLLILDINWWFFSYVLTNVSATTPCI